jgi:hypothetical protein
LAESISALINYKQYKNDLGKNLLLADLLDDLCKAKEKLCLLIDELEGKYTKKNE